MFFFTLLTWRFAAYGSMAVNLSSAGIMRLFSGLVRLRCIASNSHFVVQTPQPMHLFGSTTLRPQLRQREASVRICSAVKVTRSSCMVLTLSGSIAVFVRGGLRRLSVGRATADLSSSLNSRRLRCMVRDCPSFTKRWMDTAPSRPVAMASMVYIGPVAQSPPTKMFGSAVWKVTLSCSMSAPSAVSAEEPASRAP